MLGGLASGRNDGCGRSGQDSSTNFSITTLAVVKGSWSACLGLVLLLHGIVGLELVQHSAKLGTAPGRASGHVLQVFTVTEDAQAVEREGKSGPYAARMPSPAATPALSAPSSVPIAPGAVAMRSSRHDANATDAPRFVSGERFRSSAEIDRAALPLTELDVNRLAGLNWSGRPIRARVFIDAQGAVVDVRVLQGAQDPEVANRIRAMFMAISFLPGRLNGADVASYKDVELSLDLLR